MAGVSCCTLFGISRTHSRTLHGAHLADVDDHVVYAVLLIESPSDPATFLAHESIDEYGLIGTYPWLCPAR